MRRQFETNLFGPMNVTRAGLVGTEFTSAYDASKFAAEGWMECLRHDVAPYNIHTTAVEPGYFRTELLVDGSTIWPELSIEDYAPRTAPRIEGLKSMHGRQPGDPVKLARALLVIVGQDEPPQRFVAGADAIEAAVAKARELLAQAEASRELGDSLAYDDSYV